MMHHRDHDHGHHHQSFPPPVLQCSSLSCVFSGFFFVCHFLRLLVTSSFVDYFASALCGEMLIGDIPTAAHPRHDPPTAAPEDGKDDRDHSRGTGQPLSKVKF